MRLKLYIMLLCFQGITILFLYYPKFEGITPIKGQFIVITHLRTLNQICNNISEQIYTKIYNNIYKQIYTKIYIRIYKCHHRQKLKSEQQHDLINLKMNIKQQQYITQFCSRQPPTTMDAGCQYQIWINLLSRINRNLTRENITMSNPRNCQTIQKRNMWTMT